MTEPVTPNATSVVDALGTAWTVHSLYPEPEAQPAFRRAVEALQRAVDEPITVEIDVAGFLLGGELVETDREGADRLAKRCYLHNLEALTVAQPPSASDVARLFVALAREEESSRASGGVEAALRRHGVTSFGVVQRALLRTGGEDEPVDRDPTVQQVLDDALDPEAFARALIEETGGDPERLAEVFHERYHQTVDLVGDDDVAGIEGVVQAYVEAFFYFDETSQVAVFRVFLTGEADFDRVFLDQFAGHELAKIAPNLDSQGLALLLDYARVATDNSEARPAELLAILSNPEAVESMREVAAAKVQERLADLLEAAEAGESFLQIVADMFPNPQRYFYDSLEVFRGLLAVEDRDDRFARLIRIWIGKVSDAIRRRQFRRAELWLRSVTAKPTYREDRRPAVDMALSQIASPDIMAIVVEEAAEMGKEGADPERTEPAVLLLQALGPRAVNSLIDLLAEEENRARRRTLIGVLSEVAAHDPGPLVARLGDDRWYLVRNLLTVLRQTGVGAQSSAIVQSVNHHDHRVRIEALRTLATSGGGAVPYLERGLGDGNDKVRQTAIGLLAANPSGAAEEALIRAVEGKSTTDDKVRILVALGDRSSPSAVAALRRLSGRRFVMSAAGRSIRNAARDALRKVPS